MLVSMTGYGYGEATSELVRIQVELKGVNNRFLDVQVRVPREYMALEPRMVTLLRETFGRGRVDVHLKRTDLRGGQGRVQINMGAAREYHQQLVALKSSLGLAGEISLDVLMGLDGVAVAVEETYDPEQEWPLVQTALKGAIRAFSEMRQKEGDSLRKDLIARHQTLVALHDDMLKYSAGLTQHLQEKLVARLTDAMARAGLGSLEESRLHQEIVYYADRVDISEELTRLKSHLDQLQGLLNAREAVGRKIEFLLQELVREANTIGSKTSTPDISRCGMLVKVELEKIREQIQNIE